MNEITNYAVISTPLSHSLPSPWTSFVIFWVRSSKQIKHLRPIRSQAAGNLAWNAGVPGNSIIFLELWLSSNSSLFDLFFKSHDDRTSHFGHHEFDDLQWKYCRRQDSPERTGSWPNTSIVRGLMICHRSFVPQTVFHRSLESQLQRNSLTEMRCSRFYAFCICRW